MLKNNQIARRATALLLTVMLVVTPAVGLAQRGAAARLPSPGVTQVSPGVYRICFWDGFCFEIRMPWAVSVPVPKPSPTPMPTLKPSLAPAVTPALVTPVPSASPKATQTPALQPTPKPTAKPTPAPTKTPDDYTQGNGSAQAQSMANMVNAERTKNGLRALPLDAKLCSVASAKSQDMIAKKYFAHESPTYGSPANMLKHFGVPYVSVGENIARHSSIEKAHAALMSSTGHRQNILSSSWTRIGIGIVSDKNGYPTITQIFVR